MKKSRFPVIPLIAILLFGCSDGSDNNHNNQDQAPSSLTVVPTAAPEGAAGEMSELAFRVTLTTPQSSPVVVTYETLPGTASADEDYLQTAGQVEIPSGAIEGFIRVEVIGDGDEETAETFTLQIDSSDNATATATEVTGTIANDDTACDKPFSKDPNPWLVNGADPLNFAHRGGVTDFPENTLYAYAEAALAGADVLEMDVYQTRDNQLVILHDLDVDRTTNGQGNVVDLTLAELRALDAAYWFVTGAGTPHDRVEADYTFRGIATGDKAPPPGYSAEDFRIPTLEEALARFPHNLINIELKPDLDGSGNYEQQIAEVLRRYGRYTDLIAASFVDEAANNFKAVAPCVYTSVPLDQGTGLVLGALGNGVMPPVPEHIAFQVPPDTSQIGEQIPDDFFLEVVTPDFVADSHAVNLAVQVWTINTCEEMLRMIDLGVDAIMTDKPLLLEEILSTPPAERQCD
jgi:glycerophosphoryl diester phosphodiesterase